MGCHKLGIVALFECGIQHGRVPGRYGIPRQIYDGKLFGSPQEQEQMLDAIQAQEDRTQDKLKEKQGVVVRGTKNW